MAVTLEAEKQGLLNLHTEKHFTAGKVVRDIIIGVSDGLTVPFALAAGLSGTNATSAIVLTAGIAEVVAGAISMGLGGYVLRKYSLHSQIKYRLRFRKFCWLHCAVIWQRKVKRIITTEK